MKQKKNLLFLGGILSVLLVFVFVLVACSDDPAPPAIVADYQGVYTGSGMDATGATLTYLEVGADSVKFGTSASNTRTIGGISTGGGESEGSERWDYVYQDGKKIGAVVKTGDSVELYLGRNRLVAPYLDLSDVSTNAPYFGGTKQ